MVHKVTNKGNCIRKYFVLQDLFVPIVINTVQLLILFYILGLVVYIIFTHYIIVLKSVVDEYYLPSIFNVIDSPSIKGAMCSSSSYFYMLRAHIKNCFFFFVSLIVIKETRLWISKNDFINWIWFWMSKDLHFAGTTCYIANCRLRKLQRIKEGLKTIQQPSGFLIGWDYVLSIHQLTAFCRW